MARSLKVKQLLGKPTAIAAAEAQFFGSEEQLPFLPRLNLAGDHAVPMQ